MIKKHSIIFYFQIFVDSQVAQHKTSPVIIQGHKCFAWLLSNHKKIIKNNNKGMRFFVNFINNVSYTIYDLYRITGKFKPGFIFCVI